MRQGSLVKGEELQLISAEKNGQAIQEKELQVIKCSLKFKATVEKFKFIKHIII